MSSVDDVIKPPSAPRWIAPWLAFLAPLYVISPLALLGLPYLKRLPKTALWILGFYALSQQIPALFTPEPLLASVLALLRTLLMFGLMGVGVALGDISRLKPVAIGLGVVFVTALVYSALGGLDLLTNRLTHPYMTPITVGLAGAFGIWFALFLPGKLLWRVPLGFVGLGVLLLSGSRGPLAAALVGCVAGFFIKQGRRTVMALLLGAGLLVAGFYFGDRLGLTAVTRLSSADTTGRDIVWSNTLSIIRAYPVGGVGSYRLGQYLAPPGDQCTLFTDAEGAAPACPDWIKKLGSPWLIAHNITLQQLAETGPLGLLGLFLLIGLALVAGFQGRRGLVWAILIGLLIATISDNTLLVPSPFFAEMFWLAVGTQLLYLRELSWRAGLITSGLVLTLSIPAIAGSIHWPVQKSNFSLNFLNAPTKVVSTHNYITTVQFGLPPGDYRASLSTCTSYCTIIQSLPFKVTEENNPVLTMQGDLLPQSSQRVELRLLPAKSSLNITPLGIKSWEVLVGSHP